MVIWRQCLSGSVKRRCDYWSQGCEFECHIGGRVYLIKFCFKNSGYFFQCKIAGNQKLFSTSHLFLTLKSLSSTFYCLGFEFKRPIQELNQLLVLNTLTYGALVSWPNPNGSLGEQSIYTRCMEIWGWGSSVLTSQDLSHPSGIRLTPLSFL